MNIGKRIGIIGCGNMGEILIKVFLHEGICNNQTVLASTPNEKKIQYMKEKYDIQLTFNNKKVAYWSDIIIIAVRPENINSVLGDILDGITSEKLIVSIVTGLTTQAIEKKLQKSARIIRAMPNLPLLVKRGITVLTQGKHASESDLKIVKKIFDSVGYTIILDEDLFDIAAGLSLAGPAYLFLIAEALTEAGIKMGLTYHDAFNLSVQTIHGTSKLLLETGEYPENLKNIVITPRGPAIVGLHTLEEDGVKKALIHAVETAANQAKKLREELEEKMRGAS